MPSLQPRRAWPRGTRGWAALVVLALLVAFPTALPAATAQDGTGTPGASPVAVGSPAGVASPVAVVAGGPLPLGPADLVEERTTETVAPGVTHTEIVRGVRSDADVFAVDVAFVATQEEADALAAELVAAGVPARVDEVAERAPDDDAPGPLGYRVRAGAFATIEEANALRAQLLESGYESPRAVYSGEDGEATTGPWVVNVLEIDPAAFTGQIAPVLGSDLVPGKERLSATAARAGALAGINGGYFVVQPTDGVPGDLAGASIVGGDLLSEAVNGRTALILPAATGEGARVATVTTELSLTAEDGAAREIDGLNREPGLIRSCGGVGGDQPTEAPKHDFTCTDDSELILSTADFGEVAVAGEGYEVALNAVGAVVEVRERRGGDIPRDGAVLSGTGDAAEWLRAYAPVGARLTTDLRVLADGQPLAAGDVVGLVNGGPRLLRDGQPEITAAAEGFHWAEDPGFYYRFAARRNPRTLAGITAEGRLLLVTVDGRQPGYSVGADFVESAAILRALGAVEAVNLDGGGSTAMVVGGEVVNRPSDATGERANGDGILLLR